MSDHERNIHDPIIDTVEQSDDENDEVPPTPASERVEQTDPSHDIGSYNGDSLVVTGSPFKKSYSNSSLEETSVDSLVDEPLPIEDVALSSFRMASIHHSPLPPRQKDPHTFSVSVPDSLPPHVMELDSPEHCGERIDEADDPDFCMDKDSHVKMSQEEVDKFFSGVKEDSLEVELPPSRSCSSVPADVEDKLTPPFQDSPQPLEKDEEMRGNEAPASEEGSFVPYSQPLFDTQASQETDSVSQPPVPEEDTPSPRPSKPPEVTPQIAPPPDVGEGERGDEEETVLDDAIPSADSERRDTSKTPGIPTVPCAQKRKREAEDKGEEEDETGEDATVVRKRPPTSPAEVVTETAAEVSVETEKTLSSVAMTTKEDADSDIEILEEERSIEVVYEGGATPAVESQDLNLVLTGETQEVLPSGDGNPPLPSRVGERERGLSGRSPSLLSMGDSEPLTCGDTFSPPEEDSPPESTIRATQVEILCPNPPSNPRSPPRPNVEPLISLPIVGRHSHTLPHSPSTNGVSEDDLGTQEVTQEPVGDGEPVSQTPFTQSQSGGDLLREGAAVTAPPSISYPQFDTPTQSQTTQEASESVFVSASRAALDRRRLEEEKEAQSSSDVALEGSEENISNHSTPLGAIDPPSRSSQSTPLSSHPLAAPNETEVRNAHKLFPHISQELPPSGEVSQCDSPHQKSEIYAEDSDEEGAAGPDKHKKGKLGGILTPNRRRGPLHRVRKSSTPMEGTTASSSPDLGSSLEPGHATLNSNSSGGPTDRASSMEADPAEVDTAEVEDESVKCERDLQKGGWECAEIPSIRYWTSPLTRERVYVLAGFEERFLRPSETISEIVALTETAKKERRISEVSSISRITSITSSSSGGYIADRSASSTSSVPISERAESTRLSIASTIPSPPSRLPLLTREVSASSSSSSSSSFRLPQPPRRLPPPVPKTIMTMADAQTQTTEEAPQRRPKRGRGRAGRPQGRSKRALNQSLEGRPPAVDIPTPIKEEAEGKGSPPKVTSSRLESPSRGKGGEDQIFAGLSEEMREKLRTAQIPLTEDEEELFLLQEADGDPETHARQLEEVQRRVRLAYIEPRSLVFARYRDNNYYSAFVSRHLDGDRWEVHYNLDNLKDRVRELNILPTEILPKGTRCYIRQPDLNYSDPGLVRGHVMSSPSGGPPLLQHVVETHKGQVLRVPHSQIILSQNVAELLVESRRAFHSMIASPGGDVSLDNVVPGKLRRARRPPTSSAGGSPPKKARKPDAVLDSSEPDDKGVAKRGGAATPKGRGTPRKTPQRVPTQISEDTSESSGTSPSRSAKSPTRLPQTPRPLKPPKTPRTPKTTKTSKTSKNPQTPRNSRTPRTPVGGRRTSRTKRAASSEPREVDSPPGEGGSMNPVVSLVQLDEKVVTPPPSSSSKKRGRRPGSGMKSTRKAMKVEGDRIRENVSTVDPLLGPLPPPGCQILKGYSILITYATSSSRRSPDDLHNEHCAPLDKEYLRAQITGAAGRVVETFEEAYSLHIQTLQQSKRLSNPGYAGTQLHGLKELPADKSPSKVLCVSNSFCRTAKFIQCLTVGIPLVSSQWVAQSIAQNMSINWLQFLLPAGMSLLTGNLMEQTFKDNLKDTFSAVGNVVDVLQGEKVFLATSSNPGFGELWGVLLNAAKANVQKMPINKTGNIRRVLDRRTAVVIADSSIPEEELRRAREVGVPIVSSEWFVQSLIARCKLPYDAHPDFDYTHKLPSNKDALPVGADEEEEGKGGEGEEGGHITTRKR